MSEAAQDISFRRIRIQLLAATNISRPTERMSSDVRRCVATETERPRPVQAATYAARHTGHFGISAKIALGAIRLAMLSNRRKLI
jgi:hypothetical protein